MKLTITKKLEIEVKPEPEENREEGRVLGIDDVEDEEDVIDVADGRGDDDTAVTLASCIERMEIKRGTRSSSRNKGKAEMEHDRQLAQALLDNDVDDVCEEQKIDLSED
jgi:hypothetical protein